MAKKRVADLLIETLVQAGVERIYGVSGDSLNGITDSIRRQKQIQWAHVRHEESATFAAGFGSDLLRRVRAGIWHFRFLAWIPRLTTPWAGAVHRFFEV